MHVCVHVYIWRVCEREILPQISFESMTKIMIRVSSGACMLVCAPMCCFNTLPAFKSWIIFPCQPMQEEFISGEQNGSKAEGFR